MIDCLPVVLDALKKFYPKGAPDYPVALEVTYIVLYPEARPPIWQISTRYTSEDRSAVPGLAVAGGET